MQDYWAALAITGDPNGRTEIAETRPRWDRWEPGKARQLFFGETETAMIPGKPRAQFCRFAEAF
jgi:para-nitrobenzyl esterase